MVGIGVVPSNHINEFKNKLTVLKANSYEYQILTLADLLEREAGNPYSDYTFTENKIEVKGGGNNGKSATIDIDPDENAHYFILNFNNDEGDSAFPGDWEYCDLDYDIDLSFFAQSQQELWGMINSLPNSEAHYGAERNG
jgi:hypothetical protein